MEATAQSSNREECETSETPRNRVNKRKKEGEEGRQSGSVSTVPRTRSQVAPDWTAKEELILVNEIAAVESDCLKALSSYQKWKIIVQNCTALDVCRPLNQCRKKWDSLLLLYKQIKIWDSDSTTPPYSSLPSETRKQFGLPLNFDQELFKAIDDYVQGQNEHPDTDPDTDTEGDPEGEADLLRLIAKLESKTQVQRRTSVETCLEEKHRGCGQNKNPMTVNAELAQENHAEERHQTGFTNENPQRICAEEEGATGSLMDEEALCCCPMGRSETIHAEVEPQGSFVEKKPLKRHAEEKAQKPSDEKPKNSQLRKKKTVSTEEKEQMMVEKLRVNAELIHAVVSGKLPETSEFGAAADSMTAKDLHTAFVRHQADNLIACLGEIINVVNQFPHLIPE